MSDHGDVPRLNVGIALCNVTNRFALKPWNPIEADPNAGAGREPSFPRVFLYYGDALFISTHRLLKILHGIRSCLSVDDANNVSIPISHGHCVDAQSCWCDSIICRFAWHMRNPNA